MACPVFRMSPPPFRRLMVRLAPQPACASGGLRGVQWSRISKGLSHFRRRGGERDDGGEGGEGGKRVREEPEQDALQDDTAPWRQQPQPVRALRLATEEEEQARRGEPAYQPLLAIIRSLTLSPFLTIVRHRAIPRAYLRALRRTTWRRDPRERTAWRTARRCGVCRGRGAPVGGGRRKEGVDAPQRRCPVAVSSSWRAAWLISCGTSLGFFGNVCCVDMPTPPGCFHVCCLLCSRGK
jgi:hypothetical protein